IDYQTKRAALPARPAFFSVGVRQAREMDPEDGHPKVTRVLKFPRRSIQRRTAETDQRVFGHLTLRRADLEGQARPFQPYLLGRDRSVIECQAHIFFSFGGAERA